MLVEIIYSLLDLQKELSLALWMVAIKLKVLLCNVICTGTSLEVNVYEMYKANVHEVNISPFRQHLLQLCSKKENLTKV